MSHSCPHETVSMRKDLSILKAHSHMVLRVLLEGALRMNSYKVLDWIHFANTTSSAEWEHTLT